MPSCAEIQLMHHNRGFAGGHSDSLLMPYVRVTLQVSAQQTGRRQPFTVVRVRDWQSLARLYNQHEQYVLFMLMHVNMVLVVSCNRCAVLLQRPCGSETSYDCIAFGQKRRGHP